MILDSIDEEIRQDVIEMRSHRKGNLFTGNGGKRRQTVPSKSLILST